MAHRTPLTPPQKHSRETRERREHRERRERIEAEVAAGSLVIRKASQAERDRWQAERQQRSPAAIASTAEQDVDEADPVDGDDEP
jgi:hypothetical protein